MQELICILDRSGSMASKESDVLEGFKKFIEDQKALGEANLTVIRFNDTVEKQYEGRLQDYEPPQEWGSMGLTALLDAMGYAFTSTRERFEREKPEKVIVAVFTDGLENYSREFTAKQIMDMVKEHEEKYGWTFIYFGPSIDAWNQAQSFGFSPQNSVIYDENDTKVAFMDMSRMVANIRQLNDRHMA